jgi:hypothetical protein
MSERTERGILAIVFAVMAFATGFSAGMHHGYEIGAHDKQAEWDAHKEYVKDNMRHLGVCKWIEIVSPAWGCSKPAGF